MLTEKDYCDYGLIVELEQLGMPIKIDFARSIGNNQLVKTKFYPNPPSLYEVQKWLREEKKIIVEATFNLMYKGQPRFSWRILYNLVQHKGAYYTLDSVKSKEDYDSLEEALAEGVRASIKILQDEQKENN